MPSFFYWNRRSDDLIEKEFPCGKAPDRLIHKGRVYENSIAAGIRSAGRTKAGKWPMWSDALGVNPDQVPSEIERLGKHNIPAEFDSEGRMKINGPRHQTEVCRNLGMVNKDGGYAETYEGSDRD